MFPYFLLGLVLFAAGFFLLRWFVGAEPRQVRKVLVIALAVLGVCAVSAVLFYGRNLLAALLFPLLLLFFFLRPLRQRAKAAQGPTAGQTSEVITRFVKMSLDHDSGELSGQIREGKHAGRELSDLSEAELVALWRIWVTEDQQSASVLEGYLDRYLDEDWRERAGGEAPSVKSGPLTREEAYDVLGLEPDATKEEIQEAYRNLMRRMHPDQGGSDYLAAKINQAKDLLLGD